ncbi:MAG: aquaporin [Actinophytocola sp.]|nr:aquaporin [Actinophytocola sp.]
MDVSLFRRLGAEFIGTALLVLFGAGSVVAAVSMADGGLTYSGLGFIALAFAIVVALVIYGFGPVSGAHINPAVTFALAVSKRFSWAEVVPYMLAQLAGGALGAILLVAAYGPDASEAGGFGATALAETVPVGAGILAEVLGTFILVFAVMTLAVDARAPHGWAGFMIGLAVAVAILVTGPLTGGSLNPARTFGPNLAASLWGGSAPWADFALYWIGPLLGAAIAAGVYQFVAAPRAPEPTHAPSRTS